MQVQEHRHRLGVGLQILVRVCTPAVPQPAQSLLLIHGGCEHGGRYLAVAERLSQRGWTSVIPDLRGHGRSEGPRTDVSTVDEYLDDLRDLQAAYCGEVPPVILGHSFGGLLAIRLVQTGSPARALVLSAPLLKLGLKVPPWKLWLGRQLVHVAPRLRFRTGLDPHNMARDPEYLARRRADPLIQKHVTLRWYFAMQQAVEDAWREAHHIRGPLLVVQGTEDWTVDPTALRAWLPLTQASPRELMEFPGRVHELLNDRDWETVVDQLAQWLERWLTPSAAWSSTAQ